MLEWDKTVALYDDNVITRILDEYFLKRMKDGTFNPITQIPIFDGYPRNLNQLAMMENKYEIRKAVYLTPPVDIALRRVIHRQRPEDANIPAVERRMRKDAENIDQIIKDLLIDKNGTYNYPKIMQVNTDRPKEIVHNEIYNFFKS